jgi:hypothetical protein
MMLHLRMNASFAALAGIAMWFGLSPAGAQGTPEQRAACENDACGCAVNSVATFSASPPACPRRGAI